MSLICKRLHEFIHRLPETAWPFKLDELPRNGIYFFFEEGELWGHNSSSPRIVRVGTHREGNFRSRMADHYILNERKMILRKDKSAPKDRSIFRKNIGRALLQRDADPYLATWDWDFTTRQSREVYGSRRNVVKELEIEAEVTRILRERFTFRWIQVDGENRRMGAAGLEAAFIGALARCSCCIASPTWLGRYSPKPKIVQNGLWLEQHLQASPLDEASFGELKELLGGSPHGFEPTRY